MTTATAITREGIMTASNLLPEIWNIVGLLLRGFHMTVTFCTNSQITIQKLLRRLHFATLIFNDNIEFCG